MKAKAEIISLKCKCGALRGVAKGISKSAGHRAVCLCDDCQAYAHYLGRAKEVLDENGGTDVVPVAPSDLQITHGMENLKCLRLTKKGLMRWYAGCCNTPVANSMASRKVPFAGVVHTFMDHAGDNQTRDEAVGPIRARIYAKYGVGKLPPDAHPKAPLGLILSTIRFLFLGWITGRYEPSPFFDSATGKPVVEPYVLSVAERENLRGKS